MLVLVLLVLSRYHSKAFFPWTTHSIKIISSYVLISVVLISVVLILCCVDFGWCGFRVAWICVHVVIELTGFVCVSTSCASPSMCEVFVCVACNDCHVGCLRLWEVHRQY